MADRDTPFKYKERKIKLKMAAVKIEAGHMVCRNSSGFAVPAADTAGFKAVVGRAEATVDNSGGAAGDLEIEVAVGVFRFAASGIAQSNEGDALTVVDSQTVGLAAATTNDISAGVLEEFISSTAAWVKLL